MELALGNLYKKLIIVALIISMSLEQIFQKTPLRDQSLTRSIQKIENINKLFDMAQSQKDEIFSKRNQLISQINQKYEEVVRIREKLKQAKIQSALVYRQYYDTLMKCESLKSEIKQIQQAMPISNEICLEFPISVQTNKIFVQYAQISGFMNGSANAERLLTIQNNFVNDLNVTIQAINNLMESVKEKINSTSNSSNLKKLKDAYDRLDRLKTKINNFYQNQQSMTQSKKMIAALQAKIYLNTTLDIIRQEIVVEDIKVACEKNLIKAKQKLNAKLSLAYQLTQKLQQNKTDLNKKMAELKKFPFLLQNKTDQLKQLLKSL